MNLKHQLSDWNASGKHPGSTEGESAHLPLHTFRIISLFLLNTPKSVLLSNLTLLIANYLTLQQRSLGITDSVLHLNIVGTLVFNGCNACNILPIIMVHRLNLK